MPFGNMDRPAIGLSLLKAGCEKMGMKCDIQYANIFFAELVGPAYYMRLLQTGKNDAFGDWLFSGELYGEMAVPLEKFLAALKNDGTFIHEDMRGILAGCREKIPKYLDQLVGRIAWRVYDIVGFSCSLQQNMASLAYARKIREKNPEIKIVFGGANFEAPMGTELMRRFPFIDIVVSGEGDHVFPLIVQRLRGGEALDGIDGAAFRRNGRIVFPENPIARIQKLDELPCPDYEDYFRTLRRTDLERSFSPMLLLETSRGCWWGEKSQCTFCGLNNLGLEFRSKSSERALREIDDLSGKYGIPYFQLCDCNLERSYLKNLFPRMAERNGNWDLRRSHGFLSQFPRRDDGRASEMFYFEVKANFSKEEVKLLADAGVILFPGIESLSTPILRLVRKGCTAPQNIQVLKWCCELGVASIWNFLYGFPGEDPLEYEKMKEMIPKLVHLPPPTSLHHIILTRSSPYQRFPERFGLTGIKPARIYGLLYPFPGESLRRLAYYFDFSHSDGRDTEDYIAGLRDQVNGLWRSENQIASLHYSDDGEVLRITDGRPVSRLPHIELEGIERDVYLYCDTFRRRSSVDKFASDRGIPCGKAEGFLGSMVENALMLEIDGGFLSLAVTPRRKHLTPDIIRELMDFIYASISHSGG